MGAQLLAIVGCGEFENFKDILCVWGACFISMTGNFHPRTGSQFFDGFQEIHMFIFHEKANYSAVGAATEAVIKLLSLTYCEGGGFFLMEGAAGSVIAPGFAQGDACIDNFYNIDTSYQFVDELLGNAAGHR